MCINTGSLNKNSSETILSVELLHCDSFRNARGLMDSFSK